jgi:DNA (cytosine-5)-methyltransferase 1
MVGEPVGTITAKNDRCVVAPTLIQTSYGERPGQRPRYLDLHQPLGTVVAQGQKHALVAAYLAKHFGDPLRVRGGGRVFGTQLELPIGTITARDHHALVTASLAGNHVPEVRAFLAVYYGQDTGQALSEPMRTLTAKHRMGLVTVEGTEYQIADIGMRMLEPHELLRAQFGRFASSYDLSQAATKAEKVRLIGNSVCPEVAEALVRVNVHTSVRRAA